MTIKRMKSPFGSVPVLFVVLAVFLAMVGLIWAHWYTSLNVEANVNTGNVGIHWTEAWTNDDGVPNYWDVNDDGSDGLFSHWGPGSSPDPSGFGDERYDKDVAACWAGGGEGELYVDIQNGYPSYHCVATAGIENYGSVPIKALPSSWTLERGYHECTWYLNEDFSGEPLPRAGDEFGEFVDYDMNGMFDEGTDVRVNWDDMGPFMDAGFDGEFNEGTDTRLYDQCTFVGDELAFEAYDGMIAWGHYGDEGFVPEIEGFLPGLFGCGEQIDPGFQGNAEVGFHVMQAAQQGATYHFSMHQEFVNWNEFDDAWCDGGGPVVTPGEPDDKVKGFGVRYRSFGNTGGEEIYLGVGDLGVAANRNAEHHTWGASQHVTFTYDGAGNLAAYVDGVEKETYAGVGGSCADYMVMSVVARDAGTTVDFDNVMLDGYVLGNYNATASAWNSWTISGFDFSGPFTMEGDLLLNGTFSSSGGEELSKVELLVACGP